MTSGLINNSNNTNSNYSDALAKLVTSNLTDKIKNRQTYKQTMHIITTFLLDLKNLQ